MEKKREDAFIRLLTGSYETLSLPEACSPETFIELDLGCGKGGFSTSLALKYPGRLILSADVMIGRLRKLVKRNTRSGVENIIPLRTEARALVSFMLPDSSLDRVHILCPDPWPKARHRKHRIMSSDFMGRLKRVLKAGGVLHFSTDDAAYFEAACLVIDKSGIFKRDDTLIEDVADLKSDFEKRWISGGLKVRHAAWSRL